MAVMREEGFQAFQFRVIEVQPAAVPRQERATTQPSEPVAACVPNDCRPHRNRDDCPDG